MKQYLKQLKKDPFSLFLLGGILLFVFLRIWRLHLPAETVFDEVYFPEMAGKYLSGTTFFDIHPPLGKLIIAIGEFLFRGINVQVGWRIMPLLAGIGLLPAAYWTMRQIFNDRRAGLIAAFLFAIDGLMVVYSRTGLMDGFITLFGVLAIGFCWRFIKKRWDGGEQAWPTLLWTGFFAGLAVAVKWIGVGYLPLVAVATFCAIFFGKKRAFNFHDFLIWVVAFVVVPALLYTLPFLANWRADFLNQFILWHHQSWDYNVHLDATHPYSSKWWSWPFMIRPIWFYYKNQLGNVIGVDAIANPAVLWGSTLAVVYSVMVTIYSLLVWKRQDQQVIERSLFLPIFFLLAGWGAFYLPWTVIGRVLFFYHYMSSFSFSMLLAAFWLSRAYSSSLFAKMMTVMVLLAALVVGLYFSPIWIAYPIPQIWFDRLMWFKSWI